MIVKAGMMALFVMGATACVATSRTYTDGTRRASDQHESWTRVSFAGSTKRIDASRRCPHGIARATIGIPYWGAPIALLTLGLVTPVRAEVTCAAR